MNLEKDNELRKEINLLTSILDCGILSDNEKPIIKKLIEEKKNYLNVIHFKAGLKNNPDFLRQK